MTVVTPSRVVFRKVLEENYVSKSNLGSSACFLGYVSEKLQMGKRDIDTACFLGVKAIRIFLGNFRKKTDAPEFPLDYQGIVKAVRELCAYGAEKNVEVWIETHNEFATGKVLQRLLKDAACMNLKIIWDIIHPIEDGETIEETWECIGDSIAHIHIKDGYDRKDPAWHDYYYTPLYQRIKNMKARLSILTLLF